MVHLVCLFMKTHLLALLQDNCLDLVHCAFLRKLSGCVSNITVFCQQLLSVSCILCQLLIEKCEMLKFYPLSQAFGEALHAKRTQPIPPLPTVSELVKLYRLRTSVQMAQNFLYEPSVISKFYKINFECFCFDSDSYVVRFRPVFLNLFFNLQQNPKLDFTPNTFLAH